MGNRAQRERLAAVVLALLVWQLAARVVGNPLLLAPPLTVGRVLLQLIASPGFWAAAAFSFSRIAGGFLLALFGGIAFAALASRVPLVAVLLQPYMAVVKSTPVASFTILALIWLDASNLSVFIAFLMVLPIIYTNVLQGIRSTDPKLLEMAGVFALPWWRKLYYIYLPQVRSYLLAAGSVAMGLAWKAGIAAEVIGIPDGSIGERLYEAKIYLNTAELLAWTIAVVAISILFERLVVAGLRALFARMEKS